MKAKRLPVRRLECGTYAGAQLHKRRMEMVILCEDCALAAANYMSLHRREAAFAGVDELLTKRPELGDMRSVGVMQRALARWSA